MSTTDGSTTAAARRQRPPASRRGVAAWAADVLERRVDRRGLLRRGAMAGTALAVAPGTFVLRPGTAYAAICGPGAPCNDGYTEFCCTIYGANRCPPGTALGGWWKVDGSEFCGGGPRYYMDCNAGCGGCGCGGNGVCSGACSGTGCGCAFDDCGNRHAGCTAFRYGQCNQQIPCLGPIVCRVVTCTEPWQLDGTCTTAVRSDNATRYHNRPCLQVDAVGSVDGLAVVPGGVHLSGWALDPTTAAPVTVNVYSCLRPWGSFGADVPRADVGAGYPGLGDGHGFDQFLRLCPGEQLISVAAVDTSGQGSTWIGHHMVTIDGNPLGHLDVATGLAPTVGSADPRGTIVVGGWALDPDAYAPSTVEIRLDGELVRTAVANLDRPDIAQAWPHLGGGYGFNEAIAAAPGTHSVCVTALNVNAGANLDLGCRTVVVPANPEGALESVTSPGPGTLRVQGWAADADTTGPVAVRLTVDGADAGTHTADRPRGDGHDGHGFDITLTSVAPGAHAVCATALNVGGGADAPLGCTTAAAAATVSGQVTELAAVPGGFVLGTTRVVRTGGDTPAVLRVLVDGTYRASVRPGDAGTTEVFTAEPGLHEVSVIATIDGPRTVPVLLAATQLDIPAAVGIPPATAAPDTAPTATTPAAADGATP